MYNIFQLADFLLSDSSICVEDMDYNLHIAVLNNGIYDVDRQRLFSHTSDVMTFSYIDADFVDELYCPSTSAIDERIKQCQAKDIPNIDYFLESHCAINSEYKGELVSKLYCAYEQYCCNQDYAPKSRIEFKQYLEKNI